MEKKKTGIIKKIPNLFFICIIITVLALGLVRTIFFPTDINYYENRYAEKIISPSLSTIGDQSFQNSIENALSDQIPKSQTLKKGYNILTTAYMNAVVSPMLEQNADKYIDYMGLKIFGGDQFVYDYRYLDVVQPALDNKAVNYNEIFINYPDTEFYVYYIEKDTDINFETNAKVGASEYILGELKLPEKNKGTFKIDDYSQFREYFYRTDHHWNYKGSYAAYKELIDLLRIEDEPLMPKEEKVVSSGFAGSKSASAGSKIFTEDFIAYEFDYPEMEITLNGEKSDEYGAEVRFFNGEKLDAVTYGAFYGSDGGENIFDTGRPELENILIVGESYDNAILKLLASHYNITFSIDLRNYEHYFGKAFNIGDYIEDHDISKVLLIGNIDFFTMEEFMLEN